MAKNSISIGPDALEQQIAAIKALDEQIAAMKGNAAALKATVGLELMADETVRAQVDRYKTLIDEAEDLKAQLDQAVDEAVRARMADGKNNAEVLVEQRDEAANMASALRTILVSGGMVDDDDEAFQIPAKRKGGGGGGSKGVKVSTATYYRVRDGVRKNQSTAQNSVSSLAYYYSHLIDGKRMSKDDFAAWAKKTHGVDVDSATAWTLPLNDHVTVGMEPVAQEAATE